MNKISKKIVALATMAAFVLTLVPAAAFASDPASNNAADPQASEYSVTVDGEAVDGTTMDIADKATIKFTVKDGSGVPTSAPLDVRVWAIDKAGNVSNALQSDDLEKSGIQGTYFTTVNNGSEIEVSFARTGTYTLCVTNSKLANGSNPGSFDDFADLQNLQGSCTVTVGQEFTIDAINVWAENAEDPVPWNDDKVGEIDLVGNQGFIANGTDTYTVEGYAYDGDDRAAYQDVNVTSGAADVLALVGEAADGVVTTDENGFFSFSFTMNDNRNVPITISSGDVTYTLRILKEEATAYDIDTVQDGGYVLAGTDSRFDEASDADFSDAVQFSVTDIKGDTITDISDEPAATVAGTSNHDQYVAVTKKPAKSTLTGWNLKLVPNGDTYTLEYVIDESSADKGWETDLIPGEYTVRVALSSGDYAEATFNVAKFGTVQDIVLDMYAKDKTTNRVVTVTDEVTLGQYVSVFAKYVDENGIKIPATDGIDFGAYGKAVTDVNYGWDSRSFSTKDDIAANESLLGTTITVTAYSLSNKTYVEQELTVVDSYNAFTLEFDPAEGAVNEDNDVTVKVVKEDGSLSQVDGELQAYVADQSNEDAVVTVQKESDVSNGKGHLTVYASEPTTVDIVVAVKDDSNQGLYAATLEYTVGNVDITAHHNVVMTIGSSEYVVDKQLFTMDAAPYVDSNWRTMVPIRALAEAFDATVTYDNDARTVTIEYNDQTIVMTIDDATYTVNGVEGEMDTEAVINSADDRTYVPIRFAAEAMGFTVTALYDENSSTASVVFQS